MYAPAGVKMNHNEFPIPDTMRAWVLGVPAALFYFITVALFICASLVAAYWAEVAAGNFEP